MSVAKIEQDIQLIEEELEKIDLTIEDPIERNEYKKELQRKIKKLNRTKDSFIQLQQEQQELESLKYEVSTVKEESITFSDRSNYIEYEKSNDDRNEEYAAISQSTELAEDLKDAQSIQPNENSSEISHNYLSKRKIWISTVFALLGFIFPYIYTRRWKPFCILIAAIVSGMFILEEGEALFIAPWISAIDNGIAINKSKNKLQQKST